MELKQRILFSINRHRTAFGIVDLDRVTIIDHAQR